MQFWLAYAFGAGVLWLFARDQFNHKSWTDDERLTRILSVPHLRGDRVRKRALFVYLMLLFVVYTVFVFFAGLIVLATESGIPSADGTAGGGVAPPLALPGASVPFAVSLAMVGIAPRIELLTKVEERIRVAAHEMMGLPRRLFTSGQMIADADLGLDEIGRENILPDDLVRFTRHVEAAGAIFGPQALKVRLFERRLLKLTAYKVWVADGLWPSTDTREPYEVLEADLATDVGACLADLDDLSSKSPAGMSGSERDALHKRWNDRMKATEGLCGETCTLMFIYSEKEEPGARKLVDPLHRSIAAFFGRAMGGKSAAPELDIAIRTILAAVVIAAIWGYVGVMLRPWFGLNPDNPGVGLLTAALGALFLYGPAIIAAAAWNSRLSGIVLSTQRQLVTFAICLLLSLLFLVSLNVVQAVIQGFVAGAGAIPAVAYAALLVEAPMAVLGATQGVFVLRYFALHQTAGQPEPGRGWRLIALNVVVMLLLSVVATHLVAAGIEQVGRWSNPAFVRVPVLSDFVSRVPAAGLIALAIGLVMNSALSGRSDERGVAATPGVAA